MLESDWTPENGFKEEESVPLYYSPLIIPHPDGISLDWANLYGTLAEKHAEQKKWFPELLLKNSNILFPLPIWNLEHHSHVEFKAAYLNDDAIESALTFIISNHIVPFPIPTPTLYCMLHAGIHPKTTLSTDVAMSYLVGIYNLGPEHIQSLPLLHGKEVVELIKQIGDKEANPLAAALVDNTFKSGKLQHYFKSDRHESAPRWLSLVLVQYSLRVLQVLERQLLRFSALGYVKGESSELAMSSRISQWEEEPIQQHVTTESLKYMDIMLKSDDYYVLPINWPPSMTHPPRREEVENCKEFYYGINVKYAEFMLWNLHARIRFPPPEEEVTKELAKLEV
jgi:hypothetical protein